MFLFFVSFNKHVNVLQSLRIKQQCCYVLDHYPCHEPPQNKIPSEVEPNFKRKSHLLTQNKQRLCNYLTQTFKNVHVISDTRSQKTQQEKYKNKSRGYSQQRAEPKAISSTHMIQILPLNFKEIPWFCYYYNFPISLKVILNIEHLAGITGKYKWFITSST